MLIKGVLVTSYDQSGKIISRSNAVAFDDLILLHGIHLLPLLEYTKWKKLFKSILPTVLHNTEACTFIDDNIRFVVNEEEKDENFLPYTIERTGRRMVTAGIWRCTLIEKSLDIYRFSERNILDVSFFRCFSLFLFLKIPGDSDVTLLQRIIHLIHNVEVPIRGKNVLIESTPGGVQVFINSWSRGVITYVFGRQGCMFLTDAIVHGESSGAPVYNAIYSRFDTIRKGTLLGIVLGRIGDLNDFTCGVSLLPVLKRIVPSDLIHSRMIYHSNVIKLVDETIVMISSDNQKGSGVIINASSGIILTCSHVIENDAIAVKIFHQHNIFMGEVVFRLQELDLVVLKVPQNSFKKNMKIAESSVVMGDIVHLAGFPDVFSSQDYNIRPFISEGCVSKSMPYVIIINCSISKGMSGGAVIKNGKLIGLISFMMTNQIGFAFVIPAILFQNQIQKYIETNDIAYLKNFKSSNGNAKLFWNLNNCKL